MTKNILKAMLWKEWRETRWKWLAFALAFHIPLFIACMVFTLREAARFDLYALSDSVAAQALAVTLVAQSSFLITAGLFLLAFFAVGSIGAELDNRSMFFLFERPVRRWQRPACDWATSAPSCPIRPTCASSMRRKNCSASATTSFSSTSTVMATLRPLRFRLPCASVCRHTLRPSETTC